ncbi:unnamed protein product [Rhizophagus irregularis]|nr:unnamed protein product [Rhizophagus irregularis]
MYEFPNASTTERVNQIFEELEASDESIIKDWIAFYSKPWVRASLNPIYSFIALDIWQNAPDNTNVAESCHANCNRDGKALPLEAAILKAKNYDERQFISCDIHNCYGVAKSGKDQGVVA